jgi:hypothetical protein
MDDIVIEETMTYVARELGPMYTINRDALVEADPANLVGIRPEGLESDIIRFGG